MDELVQLIIFIAIALVAMLGSGRKKSQQRQAQRRPRRPPAPRGERGAPASADTSREQLKEDILDLLQGRVPSSRSQPPPPSPAPSAPAPGPEPTPPRPIRMDDEARPIEVLGPEPSASHREFHERYVDALESGLAARPSIVRRLTPRTAREAVIWKTIFDKPKGLE